MWPVYSCHCKHCDVDYSETMQADQVHYRRGKLHWRLGATFSKRTNYSRVSDVHLSSTVKLKVCGKDATSSALKGSLEITAASANKLTSNVHIFRNGGRFGEVGIATRYGLEDSGIEYSWGWNITCPPRPAPKRTHPLVRRVLGLSWG
jgi:hypothetical protein